MTKTDISILVRALKISYGAACESCSDEAVNGIVTAAKAIAAGIQEFHPRFDRDYFMERITRRY